mgnify:CR=1 FL=1
MSAQGITQNHVDAIAVMPEDELNRSMRRAQEQLGAMRREGASPGLRRYAEEEVCYLQREVNHRATRGAAHEAWLARNPGFRTGEWQSHDRGWNPESGDYWYAVQGPIAPSDGYVPLPDTAVLLQLLTGVRACTVSVTDTCHWVLERLVESRCRVEVRVP